MLHQLTTIQATWLVVYLGTHTHHLCKPRPSIYIYLQNYSPPVGVNIYENLKVHELKSELSKRDVDVMGKKKQQLEREFEELRRGITNVPALIQNSPDTSLDSLHLENYEISPTEPLHDIKGHLSNVTDELLAQTTGNVKKKLSSIYSSVLGKETLRCCDYRKCAILILQALVNMKADKKKLNSCVH